MSNYDLSILIPARSEQFLARTVEDILANKRGSTEILVGLDGEWAEPGIASHPDVRIVYVAQSIGQRAMTNKLCLLSDAKYVMKLDAHCAMSEGFDVEMLKAFEEVGDNVVMAPLMRNLHAFNWVCQNGHERYQGPSGPCTFCGEETYKDVVWIAKESPQSTAFCFDPEPHFQYDAPQKKRQTGDLGETMSLQGSCFMLTREKYWELNICDEEFGSWGSQGIEVAAKMWLSGGRVLTNRRCYYAHMFRTQGGDFGFPYQLSGKQVSHAKKHARELFFENKWPGQIRPLSWLVEKFWPVVGWTDEDLAKIKAVPLHGQPTKGIVYYTTNRLNTKLAHRVQDQLRKANLPIVSASLKPMGHFGKNVHLHLEPGILTYFKQIVAALEASDADIVYFAEHDVLYDPSHFDFVPTAKDMFYYNINVWRVRQRDGFAVTWEANQVAELVCYRQLALDFYRARLKEVEAGEFNRSYEPGGRNRDQFSQFRSKYPNIDIRHDANLTKSKWSPDDFRDKSTCINWAETTVDNIPGWPNLSAIL